MADSILREDGSGRLLLEDGSGTILLETLSSSPINLIAPVISGSTNLGSLLTSTTGSWGD